MSKLNKRVVYPSFRTISGILNGIRRAVTYEMLVFTLLFVGNAIIYIYMVAWEYQNTGVLNFDQPFGILDILIEKVWRLLHDDKLSVQLELAL